jgi:hypothetical protein
MATAGLSVGTIDRIDRLFAPAERAGAAALLAERCTDLPGTRGWPDEAIERIRFAALKVSGGVLSELERAVQVANEDWRDLLVAAGFAHDTQAHKNWLP